MPHFIIHCSADILQDIPEETLNEQLHSVAKTSNLFSEKDIKVRVQSFSTYIVGGESTPFIHVFAHIMQGRTEQQRAELSSAVVNTLVNLLPDVDNIAMNISQFEKSSYCNKASVMAI